MTTDAPTPARRRRWLIYAAAAALAVLLAGAAIFYITRDKSFTVTGTITVNDRDGNGLTVAGDNTKCEGRGGYADLTKTAQVVVTDAAGAVVATGAIDDFGTRTNDYGRIIRCVFTFTVYGVPAGHDFYGVEVAHRGKLTYSAEQLRNPLQLEIGR